MKSFPKVIKYMADLGLVNKFLNLQSYTLCTTSCLIGHWGKGGGEQLGIGLGWTLETCRNFQNSGGV